MVERVTGRTGLQSRADRKDRTRARIIEATIRCVAEHGVEGATVSSIAESARVSRGLAGYHFGTKSALLVAAFQSLADDYRAVLGMDSEQMPPGDIDVEESLARVIRRAVGGPGHYEDQAWLGFWSLARNDAELQRVNREAFDDVAAYLGNILAAVAGKNGRVIDAQRAGRSLSVTIEGAWLHLTVGTEGFTLQEAVAMCEELAASLLERAVEPARAAGSRRET